MTRILFICKNREQPYSADSTQNYSTYSHGGKSSGLFNSVKFMVDMLSESGVDCKMVDVVDNNCIDREVSLFKPTHVIIEALWVVPSKFAVLTKLHPKVKWIIRLHSELPFIAGEGMTFEWLNEYVTYHNVFIAANSERIFEDLKDLFHKPIQYLPNYYPIEKAEIVIQEDKDPDMLDIGCFGAIRPLKNQLIQAVAAIRFANKIGKSLRFHINGNRVEGKGETVLRNIRALFAGHQEHELVEHSWMPHAEFVNVLKDMDVTMQVSFSETYNIVAADAIAAGVPVVSSKEIKFVCPLFYADPTDTQDIMDKVERAYYTDLTKTNSLNRFGLERDAKFAKEAWMKFAKPVH
jgi:glycosyltransferase involved in cell wall biosynthesis